MDIPLFENEQIDDLQCRGLRLIQKQDGFKFGTDAVLLADFAKQLPSGRTLDFCTGSGIVPLLLSAKTGTPRICGLELQPAVCDMAKRSMLLNGLEGRIEITEGDLKNAPALYGAERFDVITCNPPYMKAGAALVNAADAKTIARHEVTCTLEDVVRAANSLLAPAGHLVLVHRPYRMAELISLMRAYGIEPKRLRLVYPKAEKEANLALIDGLKNGKPELRILPPLFLQDGHGGESAELKRIYERG